MTRTVPRTVPAILALAVLVLSATAASAQVSQVALVAAPFSKTITLPDGTTTTVPMWGFGVDTGGACGAAAPSVPGPPLTVAPGQTSLSVTLRNCLSVPVSLIIPGIPSPAPAPLSGDRIQSMAVETAPGATGAYVFDFTGRPGTYLYESGTHPAVQVQMGLYGAVTVTAAAAEAYPGKLYDAQATILLSEIDLALHAAVTNNTYGTSPGPTSTIDYAPTIFLVNGESHVVAPNSTETLGPIIPAGAPTGATLLRILNAGLETHVVTLAPPTRAPLAAGGVPVENDTRLTLIAEDANPYADARQQTSISVPAGKTHDALWVPPDAGDYAVYDRALRLQTLDQPAGGMLAKLRVAAAGSAGGPAAAPPITGAVTATADAYAATEDVQLVVGSALGVLANDAPGAGDTAEVYQAPPSGVLVLNPDGSFTYTPERDVVGPITFWYRRVSAGRASSATAVTITLASVADVPVAFPLTLSVEAPAPLAISVSGKDPDGEALSFALVGGGPAVGTLSSMSASGQVTYTPPANFVGPATTVTFSFRAVAGGRQSAPAVVTIEVSPASAAAAGQPLTLNVVGVDPRSKQQVAITSYRWTLEEDRTYFVAPGTIDENTLSVSFHRSYMPVLQSGDTDAGEHPTVEPGKRYFVSVLAKDNGYANGGAPVPLDLGPTTVYLVKGPTPTAQVRVHVFRDSSPLNGQWDTDEPALQGFHVYVDDAGGRYGMSGGQMEQDAFGNPIGTKYKPCPKDAQCAVEVLEMGQGFILTDANGYALFENLRPGKYTAKVIPPSDGNWQQTTTIEGQKGQDAWVKANEPSFFTEFGPAGPHVEIGFTQLIPTLQTPAGPNSLKGQITNLHQSRPPSFAMFSGAPFDFTQPWVALNSGTNGNVLYAAPTDADGNFEITGIPNGTYTLAIWDSALDTIFAEKAVVLPAPAVPPSTQPVPNVDLGQVPVFSWFTRLYHYVFEDTNKNGIWDAGDGPGIREVPINTRWRDGSVYQSSATDGTGFLPFEETFPFFAWQIAEVDYGRFRATGVTTVADDGGNPLAPANQGWPAAVGLPDPGKYGVLVPQPQTNTAAWAPNEQPTPTPLGRTETGPALLEAFQGFIGLTNLFMWGKAPYDMPDSHPIDINVAPFDDFPGPGDTDWNANGKFDVDEFNGGITGIVHYSTTRAENNARWGTPEPWEPGIAGVTVQLWSTDDGRTPKNLLNEAQTDGWDDRLPAGCQGQVFSYLGRPKDCYDGLRNFNQVRPGVFDGGYAFYTVKEPFAADGRVVPVAQRTIEKPLPAGKYVVKVIVPPGYRLVKEEDKNVDFGEEYMPAQFFLAGANLADAAGDPATAPPRELALEDPLYAPFCVGANRVVSAELSLFPGIPAAYGGVPMPTCDAKAVTVRNGQNAAANFFLFTEAPIAGHIVGFVLDDLSNEFDPNSPQFGEKFAPPWMPVSIRDWTGREITRTYTDRYGVFNALVPSTYTASTPIPSGMTPSMLTACINSPLKADGSADPFYNKQYSQFCYTLQYMPGTTTYLDTPVVPTGAFAGPGQITVDAELPDKTPVIATVTGPLNIGPYVIGGQNSPAAGRLVTLTSAGAAVQVPNPAYDGTESIPKTIPRDYSFGPRAGQVRLGGASLTISSWTPTQITLTVPTSAQTDQLTVVRCANEAGAAACPAGQLGRESVMGVTLTVATATYDSANKPRIVDPAGSGANTYTTIQAAVDNTPSGGLVLVKPGTYDELVIMDKPVRLQGWGAPSTTINAVKTPAEKMQAWRDRLTALFTATPGYLLAFQQTQFTTLVGDPTGEVLAPVLGGEGAAVTVLGRTILQGGTACPAGARTNQNGYGLQSQGGGSIATLRSKARIDGFSLTGSDQAAGVEINANACNIEVLNNRIYSNTGDFGSGVRIGHPGAVPDLADDPAHNDFARVAYNHILQNTSLDYDAGGAVAIGSGANRYSVDRNFIAGNFTQGRGAGIAHVGLSDFGSIDRNTIVFNEVFNQDSPREGGGIYIGGRPPAVNELTPGAGDVNISRNLIQGNAAIGDGGGIALAYVNGQPLSAVLTIQQRLTHLNRTRFRVLVFGNDIVNNVAGLAGGGISLQDALDVDIVHDTIAHNDSLAVAGAAFTPRVGNAPYVSTSQPAGIVSRGNSPQLAAGFSNPMIMNSIIWENRSFHYGEVTGGVQIPGGPPTPTYGLIPDGFRDLGVLGAGGGAALAPSYSVVTAAGPGSNNITTPPAFLRTYFNGDRRQTIVTPDVASPIPTPAAFDEGGNFIRPMFGPLTLNHVTDALPYGDYHLGGGVVGQSLTTIYGFELLLPLVRDALTPDLDGNDRPLVNALGTGAHRGFDQAAATGGSAPPARYVRVSNASVVEGNTGQSNLVFTVRLCSNATGAGCNAASSTVPVTVDFRTSDGTATDVSDYIGASGTVTFPANSSTPQTITIRVQGDVVPEPNETVVLTLSTPVNASIPAGQGQATGTITNDDGPVVPSPAAALASRPIADRPASPAPMLDGR